MSRLDLVRAAVTAIAVSFATSCTVGPDYEVPQTEFAPAWHQARESGLVDGAPVDAEWWRTFSDPLLDELVARGLQKNLDLRASFARLQSARALAGVAAADLWPLLDARASYEHREDSENTPFGEFIPRTNIHAIGVDASWELDLWGRVRRSVEAADSELQASEADLQAAAISVAGEVVATYVDLRAAQRRLQIAQQNLALQERTLALVQARFSAGLVVERDVAQAATNVESTRARLPALEASAIAAQNRLVVLLVDNKGEILPMLTPTEAVPVLPLQIAVGVPADLLRRRPDVRAAERRFAAAIARVGVAEAERYPRFTLFGTLGLAGNSADTVFADGSEVAAFGPSVRWNLFDGGRLRQRVAALEATAEVAQLSWEKTVLLAVEETENAMTSFVREQARRAALQRAALQARRAVQLAQTQYGAGLSDFQSVIDSERTVAQIEDDLVTSGAVIARSVVGIFKALGGGVPAPAIAKGP